MVLHGSTENTLDSALKAINDSENEEFRVFLPDMGFELGLELLKSKFKFIIAAGGIVISQKKSFLAIFRLGCWDLPKGKVEKNEDIKQAAEREIIEETGISHLNNQTFLTKTYHTYLHKEKNILKETWWYTFDTSIGQELRPQIEEDITDVQWISFENIELVLSNTYPSIADVLDCYLKK